jgi:hypothetical protein
MDEIDAAYTERGYDALAPARSGTLSVKIAAEWKGKQSLTFMPMSA